LLAAYDGSIHSRRAARHAAVLAARLGRDLVVVGAGEKGERAHLDRDLGADLSATVSAVPDTASARLGLSVEEREGEPVATVTSVASEVRACLVVTGTRGLGDFRTALFGSVTLGLIRSAGRPVVLVSQSAGYPV